MNAPGRRRGGAMDHRPQVLRQAVAPQDIKLAPYGARGATAKYHNAANRHSSRQS